LGELQKKTKWVIRDVDKETTSEEENTKQQTKSKQVYQDADNAGVGTSKQQQSTRQTD